MQHTKCSSDDVRGFYWAIAQGKTLKFWHQARMRLSGAVGDTNSLQVSLMHQSH